jgi:hypothetical protein
MSIKQSSYQKLKAKIEQLEAEKKELEDNLELVIIKPDSRDALMFKMIYKHHHDIKTGVEKLIWSGDNDSKIGKFEGLINQATQ